MRDWMLVQLGHNSSGSGSGRALPDLDPDPKNNSWWTQIEMRDWMLVQLGHNSSRSGSGRALPDPDPKNN